MTITTDRTTPGTTPVSPETERELAPLPLLWAKALDEGDAEILDRLLTDDVVVDLTPATTKIGLELPVLAGKDA